MKIEMLSWEEAMLKRNYPDSWAKRQPPQNPDLKIRHTVFAAIAAGAADTWRSYAGGAASLGAIQRDREERLMFGFGAYTERRYFDGLGEPIDFSGRQ